MRKPYDPHADLPAATIHTATQHNLRISLPLPPRIPQKPLSRPGEGLGRGDQRAKVGAFCDTLPPGEGGGEGKIQKLGLCRAAVHPTRRNRLRLPLYSAAALLSALLAAPIVSANPKGGVVVRGNAGISNPAPKQVRIDQKSGKAVINWNGFSIDTDEVTEFRQPGKDSIALNRVVTPKNPSRIDGQLKANGNVWLINQNGVTIGPDGQVHAQGFLATTADIADDDFMQGNYNFKHPSSNPNAKVVNQGTISLGERGLGGLVAPHARNDGLIQGEASTVAIAGAETFAVDFYGDGLINFATTGPVTRKPEGVAALAENNGELLVDGGKVLITADAAEGIIDQVIKVGGKINASSATRDGGKIVLDGGRSGTVAVTGTLDASSTAPSGRGGKIDIRGHKLELGWELW